jgi:hypothetical protein
MIEPNNDRLRSSHADVRNAPAGHPVRTPQRLVHATPWARQHSILSGSYQSLILVNLRRLDKTGQPS